MIYNPIIRGFNPDPSITTDGKKYYIVVSTFEYMPGLTIYSSEDLSSWEFETAVIDDNMCPGLKFAENSMGLYAPTIRYFDGMFYIVCTEKTGIGNFIIHSKDIHGPWSKPQIISTEGIDPSIFFDEDGKCFYVQNKKGYGIIGSYINPISGKLLEPLRILIPGITGAATEGPHIIKRKGMYYLFFAEGGTKYGHHENVARATNIEGPYEILYKPILSHVSRTQHQIQATGHADIIERGEDKWIAVFLAIRKNSTPLLHTMGRESFMAEITWIDGWPMIGRSGQIEIIEPSEIDTKKTIKPEFIKATSDLSKEPILRPRGMPQATIKNDKIFLNEGDSLGQHLGSPSCILMRQRDFSTHFTATLDIMASSETFIGGCVVWLSNQYFAAIEIKKLEKDSCLVSLRRHIHDLEAIQFSKEIKTGKNITFDIITNNLWYEFKVNDITIGKASYASFAIEGTSYTSYTGTLIGIFSEQGTIAFSDGFGFIK